LQIDSQLSEVSGSLAGLNLAAHLTHKIKAAHEVWSTLRDCCILMLPLITWFGCFSWSFFSFFLSLLVAGVEDHMRGFCITMDDVTIIGSIKCGAPVVFFDEGMAHNK